MVNERQSSNRGCSQRGANRRDFVLQASHLIRFAIFGLTLFASSNALAQNFTVSSFTLNLVPLATTLTVTADMCDNSTPLTFKVGGVVNFTNTSSIAQVKVYAITLANPGAVCPSSPSAAGFVQQIGTTYQITTTTPGNVTIEPPTSGKTFLDETDFGNPTTASLGTICGDTPPTGVGLCAYVIDSVAPTTNVTTSAPAIPINANTAQANIEVGTVESLDAQLKFPVTTNQNETAFTICYSTTAADPILTSREGTSATTNPCPAANTVTLTLGSGTNGTSTTETTTTVGWEVLSAADGGTPLVNGTTYYFIVAGNAGNLWSTPVSSGAPVARYPTLALYQGPDSGVSWQCAQSNAPLSMKAIFGLVALLITAFLLSPSRRRKGRQILAKGLFIWALFLVAPAAQAYPGQLDLGLTGTFYKPNLDKGTTFPCYECLYDGAWVPRLGLDFDVHVWDPFGSLQLGIGANFAWANGSAAVEDHQGETNCALVNKSSSPIGLNLLQVTPRITYVFDEYLDYFPLVPYVQFGLPITGYYFTYQGNADKKGQPNGHNPIGLKFGWEVGVGAMFLLDILEPSVAAGARAVGTYCHTYLKAGVKYQSVNDFGRPGYDFSPAQFGRDLPLQIDFAIVFEFQ